MSDTPPQDPPTVTPPPAAATPPPAPAPTLATTPADQLDAEKLRELVLTQRQNEATLQSQLTEARKAQEELATLKAAQLTDQERLQQERDQAIAEAADARRMRQEAFLLAELAKSEHGIVDAEAAAALISGVEYGDDGRPTNAAERITALLEAKGFLKASDTPPPPRPAPNVNPGGTQPGADGPKLEPEEVRMAERLGMSLEKYAALKEVRTADDYAKVAAAQQPPT